MHSVIYGTCSKSRLGTGSRCQIYEELYVLTKNCTALEVGEGAYHLVSKGTCAIQGLKEITETKQIPESFPQLLSSDSFFVSCEPQRDHRAGTIRLSQIRVSFRHTVPLHGLFAPSTQGFKLGQTLVSSVCVHTQKPEVGTGCPPLSPSTSLLRLSGQDLPIAAFPVLGLQVCATVPLFTWVPGSRPLGPQACAANTLLTMWPALCLGVLSWD